MISARDVLDRNAELKAARAPIERQWREIAQLMAPEQEDMFSGSGKTNVYDDIYDATAMFAAEAFTNGIYSQMTNPANRWFELGIEDEDLAAYYPVKQWLWRQSNRIYATLAPARSKFYAEAPGWFGDLGIFGMGTIYAEEDPGAARIIDRTIPLGDSFIDLDADGDLDTFHRVFKLTGRQAKQKFPELDMFGTRVRDQAQYEFVHAVWPNPGFDARRIGVAGKRYLSAYVCGELQGFMRLGGYHEMPYQVVMWKRRPGRVYPVGPGHLARADTSMINEMERTHIVAAQFIAEPPILVHDEDTFSPADLYPNAVIPGMISERGQPLAQPLNRGQNVQLSLDMSNQRREAIREAFFFSVMQLVKRPQMTATEFLGFQEETLRQMGPALARIQVQGLSPLLARRFQILARAGAIEPPPEEREGVALQPSYTSPLAKLQKAADARAALQYVTSLGQIAAQTGDQGIMDNVDGDAAAGILHEAYGPPPSIRRDPAQVEQLRQSRAQIAAQQQQLAAEGQMAETEATRAHAAQAATRAGERIEER